MLIPIDKSGSRIGRLTKCITILTTSTAIHPKTSSIIWRETARSFNVVPFFNRKTAAPFTTIPNMANRSIPVASGVCGSIMRSIHSLITTIEPASNITDIKIAPISENRLYP